MGKTPDDIRRMSERDRAAFWVLHHRIAPIGPERLDALFAMLATVAARSAGNRDFQFRDALIFKGDDDDAPQSVAAMQAAMQTAGRNRSL